MKLKGESAWVDGIRRHLEDLQEATYEGASGTERNARYQAAFDLLTPVAVDVLHGVNAMFLRGSGDVSVQLPGPDGYQGLIGSWRLTWPELSETSNRMTGGALRPVTISAIFPPGFTHPHLVARGPVNPQAASVVAWPMQVTSAEDAELQRPLLWAIATVELHDRIYQSSWRVVPQDRRPT